MNVLLGMENAIKKYRPDFLIEIHYKKIKLYGFKTDDLLQYLSNLNDEFRLINKEYEAVIFIFIVLN
jgi:hypothetical protein